MTRQILFYLPPDWGDGMIEAWRTLADDVITDAEAGQRGAKASKLFQMICTATFVNVAETTRLLKEIKAIHDDFDKWQLNHPPRSRSRWGQV
jgi:hypothetical protein